MRKNLLKTALVAIAMVMGVNSTWGQEELPFSITYDFKTYCESLGLVKNKAADATQHPTKKGRISGLATESVDFYYIEDYAYNGKEFYFDRNFAIQNDDIVFRNGGTSALQATKNNRHIALINLKAGDKVTFTLGNGSVIKFGNANVTEEGVTAGTTEIVSGQEYTIKEDGDLALSFNQWAYLLTATIKSSVEFLTAPKCVKETAGDNIANKILTVTNGRNNDPEANLVTYYTTNAADDPATSENKKVYEGPITVTESSTYYFKTVNTHTGKASALTTVDVTDAGKTTNLNAPTMGFGGFKENANKLYNYSYVFDTELGNVLGTPDLVYTCVFEGETTTGKEFVSTKAGKVQVTVSAEGYTPATAEFDVEGGDYAKVTNYDFTDETKLNETWTLSENTERWLYDPNQNETYYSSSITGVKSSTDVFEGFTVTVGAENRIPLIHMHVGKGIQFANAAGNFTIKLNTVADDEIVENVTVDKSANETYVLANGITIARYSEGRGLKEINVYKEYKTVPVSISAAGYTTFSNESAVDFSAEEGLTVYTAEVNPEQTSVKLIEVADKKVPANSGVLLKGEGTFTGVATTGVAAFAKNDFVASEGGKEVTVADGIYVLNNKRGIGFYPFAGTLTSGKAHLVITSSAKSLTMEFGDDTTGINEVVKANDTTDVYYTLSGVRVQKPTKGLYILNGKKVVVK